MNPDEIPEGCKGIYSADIKVELTKYDGRTKKYSKIQKTFFNEPYVEHTEKSPDSFLMTRVSCEFKVREKDSFKIIEITKHKLIGYTNETTN